MMKSYAGLHNHSEYSNLKLIDSINRVEDLIDTAYEKGLSAVALTDHDALSGHVRAVQHYNKNYQDKDFQLILGNEIYVVREGLTPENYEKGEKFYHMVLLAKNKKGHEQLRKLSSRAWDRSFVRALMRTPTYPSDLVDIIGSEQGNISATTACLGGVPGRTYLSQGEIAREPIREFLKKFEGIFGKGNFFIELQPSNQEDQIRYNKFMIKEFWGEFPFVFATDAHYLNKEDAPIHKAFLNSKQGDREVDDFYSAAYVMTLEEVYAYFGYIDSDKLEKMRLNTYEALHGAESYDLAAPQTVPTVPVTIDNEGLKRGRAFFKDSEYKYIKKYMYADNQFNKAFILDIFKGFKRLEIPMNDEYLSRLEYELEQLWETSVQLGTPISNYFLTMARMIDIIWEGGDSLVGVSRGSAAGFLVNYALGITQLDPLRQALDMPAWRFIHKDRPGLPDIDIDCEGDKRTKVFNKVREYFQSIGGDVINVCTFGTEKTKSAIRTAARGLEIDDDIVAFIVSLVPNERGFDWTLSQCYNGDDEHKAIAKFKEQMDSMPALWEVASKIEGLVTRLGVHAAGVIAVNEEFTKYNSLMKTSKGVVVSAYNLDDTEYMGGLKYDFLTINALDKIRTTLNLLLEDDVIEWQGTLRKTYDKYMLPKNLDFDSEEMWEMAHKGEIVDLFQFDTPVGAQAVRSIQPTNIAELAIANSLMRLMKQEGADEMPADTYVRNKNDIRHWYHELSQYALTPEEVKVLEKYLLPLSGVADSQESVMMITMDPEIAGFDVTEANGLRKAIAKKKKDILEKTKEQFYAKGEQLGTSIGLLNYVWDVQIARQIGYSFSVLHTVGYSTIAIQEMNLATKYPIIYWNTACLSSNAGAINEEDYFNLLNQGVIDISDEEDKRKANKVQYGKVAAAIGKFRHDLGVKIELPDINIARFGFTPNAQENSIVFGMKGVSRIGDALINNIMDKRPYVSLNDFLDKMVEGNKKLISKDRVINLIKAGAFDKVEKIPREQILMNYINQIADKKNRVNLQNMLMLIRKGLLPSEFDEESKIYMFTKYLRTNKFRGSYYILDDIAMEFYNERKYPQHKLQRLNNAGETITVVSIGYWDSIYETSMNKVRDWMKRDQEKILNQLNELLFKEEYEKYAEGNLLRWELDALNFYHSGHELEGVAEQLPILISKLDNIPDNEIIGEFNFDGKVFPKYQIRHIFGTVLDKDKQKHLVTLSTPEGVINVKVYRTQFAKYDHVHSHFDEDNNKVVDEESFFKKGTFLVVSGIKRGDVFVPKVYRTTGVEVITKIDVVDGKVKKAYNKS